MLEMLVALYRDGRSVPAAPSLSKGSAVFLQKLSSQNRSIGSIASQASATWPSAVDLEAYVKPPSHSLVCAPWEGVRFLLSSAHIRPSHDHRCRRTGRRITAQHPESHNTSPTRNPGRTIVSLRSHVFQRPEPVIRQAFPDWLCALR